jgi:DNA-binding response OmpR family regulator/predicted regulator of Ras-like GTPase activity (Roadblock/LC7/MglB family)
MSEVWRIFVVEGDESLNRNIINSLRKDGYDVQGVLSGPDAVRVLWSEEYDIVICDLKTPGAEGIELLQWLRAYRPSTVIILVGDAAGEENDMRMQALEGGAASYLEKPLDIHILKEELRRLLQQTGFSANLDSFDLLDVIQIITMSRKSIALLINTGLEERGILRFNNGELIWAEYGILRGEEAFFALAAHKNGTVIDQPWNDHIASNVTQPLSRLIFQALQYRTKYANKQQFTGEQEVISSSSSSLFSEEIDDRPFAFFEDLEGAMQSSEAQEWVLPVPVNEAFNENTSYQSPEYTKEWWEKTGSIPEIKRSTPAITHQLSEDEVVLPGATKGNRAAENGVMASYQPPVDLPSWLTDQPTASNMPIIPSAIISTKFPDAPMTPLSPSSSPGWQYPENGVKSEPLVLREAIDGQQNGTTARSVRRSSPAWQMPEGEQNVLASDSAQALVAPGRSESRTSDNLSFYNESQISQPLQVINPPRLIKRNYNYASLVAALQTLGYAIAGFEAAAVVTMEGKPIAQVSIDDQDLSQHCKHLCATLKSALQLQEGQEEDALESLVLERSRRRTLLRIVGSERDTFLALMTRRDADLAVSRDIIETIENAINIALRG